jgi:hypothetical protein
MGNVAEARRGLRSLTSRAHTQGVFLPKAWLALARLEETSGNVAWARSTYRQACAFGPSPGGGSRSPAAEARATKGQEAGAALWQSWARFEEAQADDVARKQRSSRRGAAAAAAGTAPSAAGGARRRAGAWAGAPPTLAGAEAAAAAGDAYAACCGVYAEASTRFESDAQLWCGWAAVEAKRGRHREVVSPLWRGRWSVSFLVFPAPSPSKKLALFGGRCGPAYARLSVFFSLVLSWFPAPVGRAL